MSGAGIPADHRADPQAPRTQLAHDNGAKLACRSDYENERTHHCQCGKRLFVQIRLNFFTFMSSERMNIEHFPFDSLPGQFPAEPGSSDCPLAFDCSWRYSHRFGRLLIGQSAIETQFHETPQLRIELG